MPATNYKHHTKKDEVIAAITTLRTANAQASCALDSALANIAARELEWPAREQRAIAAGRALAAIIVMTENR